MPAKLIAWLIVAGCVALGGWIFAARYHECRAAGFSTFYCWTN